MQAERMPERPRLSSLQGFQYCELLFDLAEPESGSGPAGLQEEEAARFRQACHQVLERSKEALRIAQESNWPLDVALNYLSLARAHLGLALTAPETHGFAQATETMDAAVDCLRLAGQEDYLPCGLLARAALRRIRSDFSASAADLVEVLEIAGRGSMRLHECDAHLEWARLCLDQRDTTAARRHLVRARELVDTTGYGRRKREVSWLEGILAKETAQ
jgi:hypothetical protein